MRRRRFVASVSALAVGLAGCTAERGETPAGSETPTVDSTGTETPASSPSPTATRAEEDVRPTVQNHSVETVETDCLNDDATGIDVSFAETSVAVDGVAETPTPCYEARVDSARVTGGELRVGLAFDDDGSDVCVECVGRLTYSVTITLDTTDGVDAVTVTHGDTAQFTGRPSGDEPTASPSEESYTGRRNF